MASKNKSASFLGGISRTRKLEIAGILIMAIGTLVALSILTYHPADYGYVQSLSPGSIASMEGGPALRVQNGLGVLGAYLSHFFVYSLFGYVSVIFSLLVVGFGWMVFRCRDVRDMVWPISVGLWTMVLLATSLGLLNNEFGWLSSNWSGQSGLGAAYLLHRFTNWGAFLILLVMLVVTAMMVLDRDLQKSIDRVKSWFAAMKGRWEERLEERSRRREERGRQREVEARQQAEKKVRDESTSPSVQKRGPEQGGGQRGSDGAQAPSRSIDDIVEESQKEDEERRHREQQEVQSLDTRTRAILDKDDTRKVAEEEEDDVDISVFVGEGEEEADQRALERQNKDKARDIPEIKYKFPSIDLLDSPPHDGNEVDMQEIKDNKRIILDKLKRHKIEIRSINAIVGPTVTLYELDPAPDVKISKIESYANDLKMATAAHGLRIIAPIPGRSAVGIEVPNGARETVYMKTVINTKKFVETDFELPLAFGKTIENEVFMVDLTKMPHLLIAGATGSGKTVGINTIITCLLYKCHPDNLKFVLMDPKKIELSLYRHIQNHFLATLPGAEEPIVTDTSKAQETLESLTEEMDERYELLKMAMVRDIKDYNEKFDNGELDEELGHRHLPYIVVVIDELADLMMTAGKQIEEPIARLAQLARAVGLHLVVATQRPSVNVITGTIKANFPARIAYQVASKVDSRTILDIGGADQLIGNGDMLFTNGGGMTRIQNAYVSTEEVERITAFIGGQLGYKHPYHLPVVHDESADGDIPDPLEDIDELFESAAKVVVLHQQGSVSLLQRKLKIGYNRAGRIIDQLYNAGVVGPYQGSTARDVLVDDEDELEQLLNDLDEFDR
ncbi:MAG: DNA translocase FtsK [Balneolaceae bacterium]|nr:DNA translocase FtsK [Balneolaceae bacterium]